MKIIDGRKIRDEILESIKKEIEKLSFRPIFCDILVGNDLVSKQYVELKKKIAQKVGIEFQDAIFPETITTEALINEIQKLNQEFRMCGIIVQLPLPDSLDTRKILNAIDPKIDVDCLGIENSQKFYQNNFLIGYPTALACLYILDLLNLDLRNKKIVILGQGELVGRPVQALLSFRGLEVIGINRETLDKEKIIQEADIIISGMGNGKYLTGEMVKNGVIIIDAGTSESGSGVVGDVDLDSVQEKVSFISPVPGGVGPVTVAMLLQNILKVAQIKNKNE